MIYSFPHIPTLVFLTEPSYFPWSLTQTLDHTQALPDTLTTPHALHSCHTQPAFSLPRHVVNPSPSPSPPEALPTVLCPTLHLCRFHLARPFSSVHAGGPFFFSPQPGFRGCEEKYARKIHTQFSPYSLSLAAVQGMLSVVMELIRKECMWGMLF